MSRLVVLERRQPDAVASEGWAEAQPAQSWARRGARHAAASWISGGKPPWGGEADLGCATGAGEGRVGARVEPAHGVARPRSGWHGSGGQKEKARRPWRLLIGGEEEIKRNSLLHLFPLPSTRSSSSSFQLIATTDGLRRGDRGCSHGRFGDVGLWRAETNAWRRRGAAVGVAGAVARGADGGGGRPEAHSWRLRRAAPAKWGGQKDEEEG